MTSTNFVSSLKHATVFVNPVAGSGRSIPLVPKIQTLFETARCAADFVTTPSVQKLEDSARVAMERGSDLLMALGGDGTFQALVNATHGADVVLGILPGGGGNDFADALGLPQDPIAAARAILAGVPRWVDLARARTADGRQRLYVGGGGLGIDAEAAQHASGRYSRLPGRARYIFSALRALAGYRGAEVRAEFPDSDLPAIEMKALLAAVLNTPSYGARIKLAPDARLDDGWLDVVIVEHRNAVAALALLPGLLTSAELRTRRIKRARARRIRLSTNSRCLFHGDGEILGPAPVEIEVIPRAARVLAPVAGSPHQPR